MPDSHPLEQATPGCAVAVIPARGGSKSIQDKNLQEVGGVPLVERCIRALQGSAYIGRVLVSTDDPATAEVARSNGADVVQRPAALCLDTSNPIEAVKHAVEQRSRVEGVDWPMVILAQCTTPFMESADVDGVVETLVRSGADSAMAAARFPFFLWKPDTQGYVTGINHDHARPRQRRQELETQYIEAGFLYAAWTEAFLQADRHLFGRIAVHEVPWDRVLDINDPEDLDRARAIAAWRETDTPVTRHGTERGERVRGANES